MTFKRLFFDIENSSMIVDGVWQLKQTGYINPDNIVEYGKILCLSYKWEGNPKVHTIKYDIKNNCDKQLCLKFLPILLSADEVVGHNGDRHDIPWVMTRLLFHKITSMPQIKSIDTLKNARKFKFPSNKLDEISKYLGLRTRKVKTRGNEMWQDVTRRKNKKALHEMALYCEGDVILLEEIYNLLKGFSKPKTHMAVELGGDRCDCPHCGSENTQARGKYVMASGTEKHKMSCNDCRLWFNITNADMNFRTIRTQKREIQRLNQLNNKKGLYLE